jgi:hypothetical protein
MCLVPTLIWVLAFGVIGCGASADNCTPPLSDYGCVQRDDCPTYEELLELVNEQGPTPCADTEFFVYARNIDGGGLVLYYDESRDIVAAESFGYQHDSCGGQVLYGPVPSCPEEQWWRGSYCFSCRGSS